MDIEKTEEQKFMNIALIDVSKELATSPEYGRMIDHINSKIPAIKQDTENFYKSGSQFKNAILDVTDMTPMGSLKHILAVIDRTRQALEEGHIDLRRQQIKLKQKTQEYDAAEDVLEKELLWLDVIKINCDINNLENGLKGSLRKLSFFTTQYEAIMNKLGKTQLTEEEYEKNESRHHIMTAMKQALNSSRPRNGFIDEGNHIYLFEMGINGAVAQAEIFAYLNLEQEMLARGEQPTHEMTIQWLEACADKFENCATNYAQNRGLIPLDNMSLLKELTDGTESR